LMTLFQALTASWVTSNFLRPKTGCPKIDYRRVSCGHKAAACQEFSQSHKRSNPRYFSSHFCWKPFRLMPCSIVDIFTINTRIDHR
ncbi:MAG: hypothetical protein ACO20L_01605, partial [Candidatus Puniceispirillaceae bacterium]